MTPEGTAADRATCYLAHPPLCPVCLQNALATVQAEGKARVAALAAALRRHGHSPLCGLLIGDDTLCGECRAIR